MEVRFSVHRVRLKMSTLTIKLLVALICFTAMYIPQTEAADTCHVTTASCLPGLPGRDGRDGQPGRDGSNGQLGRDGATGPSGPPGPPITINILNYIGAECRGRRSFHACNLLQGSAAVQLLCSFRVLLDQKW